MSYSNSRELTQSFWKRSPGIGIFIKTFPGDFYVWPGLGIINLDSTMESFQYIKK